MDGMLSDLDRRYLKTFTHLSTRLLSYFDHDLIRYIVQTASSGCNSQHALLALSTQLELFGHRAERKNEEMAPKTLTYSLHHYEKAIQSLHRQLAIDFHETDASIDILITVALLISYELLRGNDIAALIHLEGALTGLDLLRSRMNRIRSPVLGYLRNVFMRLELQSISYLGERKPSVAEPLVGWELSPYPDQLQARNRNWVLQLRNSLLNLQYRIFQLLRLKTSELLKPSISTHSTHSTHQGIPSYPGGNVKYEVRDKLLAELFEWRRALDQILFDDPGLEDKCLPSNILDECRLLSVLYYLEFIRLSTCFEDETAYDTYAPQFAQIITYSSTLISAQEIARRQLFTVEMSLIDPLYWTSLKCRDPLMRREAAQLLCNCGKEGVWDGAIMAAVAHHVIDVEESLATAAGGRVHGVGLEVNRNEASAWVTCYVLSSPISLENQTLESELMPQQWQEQRAKIFYQ
jgi:hypothetical protein